MRFACCWSSNRAPAAPGAHVLDLAEGLTARGCEVHVIYSTRRLDKLFSDRLAELKGVRHIALPIRTSPHPADFGIVRAVRKHMRQFGPFDIVHGHSSKGGAIAAPRGVWHPCQGVLHVAWPDHDGSAASAVEVADVPLDRAWPGDMDPANHCRFSRRAAGGGSPGIWKIESRDGPQWDRSDAA